MQNFQQYTPTEIVFGKDTEKEAGRLAKKWGAHKVMIVYGGGSVVRSGLLDTVKAKLDAEALSYVELSGVKPNPRLSLVEEGVKQALDADVDFLLAVGGGSVIDTAKAISIGAANPDTAIWDIWSGKAPAPTKSLRKGVILTIAAAGSETSDSCVITNEAIGKKAGLCSDQNRPDFAIMDPTLTYTLPKYQVACGVVDIFMHTLDRYFTPAEGNVMTDVIAEGLMRTVIKYGPMVYEKNDNYDAMSEIMWCGSLSHNGITGLGRPRDFSCHKLGHEIGGMFDEAHGATLSAVWGSWARYVYQVNPDRFARYAKEVWDIEKADVNEAALAGIERTEAFFRSLDMPTCIGELSIGVQPDEALKKMAQSGTNNDTVKQGSFKPMGMQDMYEIYRMANHA